MAQLPGLLIKTSAAHASSLTSRSFSFGGVQYETEPLFQVAPPVDSRLGLAAPQQWFLAHPVSSPAIEHMWDAAHATVQEGFGFTLDAGVSYAEPDMLHEWPYRNSTGIDFGGHAMAAGDLCVFNEQDPFWPRGTEFGWHLNDAHSQLKSARELVGDPAGWRVRIGHLDTGYDPDHAAKPLHLNPDLQWNFVENTADAKDPAARGFMKNPGHGTGTIGILAGGKLQGMTRAYQDALGFLGGAPFAEIVAVRIAESVVHFYTSAMAKGLDYIRAPRGNAANRCDVVSISMGGVASAAWADAVNNAYEAGICIVAAAGNNFSGMPSRHMVYPARFHRVLAACGVNEDGEPYYRDGAPISVMQGSFGPDSKMDHAIGAYTPNIPWAELGCAKLIDENGAGTSAATPQVAAAAALWLQKNGTSYQQGWQRVEAVRRALFTAARKDLPNSSKYLGNGVLRAKDALSVLPASLTKSERDSVFLPFLSVLTGLGIASPARVQMYHVETMQLFQTSPKLQEILNDPEAPASRIPKPKAKEFFEALLADDRASSALKSYVESQYTSQFGQLIPAAADGGRSKTATRPLRAVTERVPPYRRLRGYAFDPSLSTQLETAVVNSTVFQVKWEDDLKPGPAGEYIEVVDYDPASQCFYEAVDLNDRYLLAQDGLEPSEGNPKFHQQFVYTVAMNTIAHFERALGRQAMWAPREENGIEEPVERLRIYPHALRDANAYYSPDKRALLFGYFPASDTDPGSHYPGGTVFTCLSHDIVAHETTHALLDGMHHRFNEPTNADMLAFHEAFADLVALFQHFSMPEVLRHQIAKTRGDLGAQSLLGELAQQFGQAIGSYGALRDAIGRVNPETKRWEPLQPDPFAYKTTMEPHARGSILVAAVFDAFLSIYKSRVADLLRVATGGTGVLPNGSLLPDLVNRLSNEAAKSAGHVLTMCIRALDYCPPVDLTFGDYLRALITADYELVSDDDRGYRVAMVEAFRRRGIYPTDVRTLSVDALLWQPGFDTGSGKTVKPFVDQVRKFAEECRYTKSRRDLFEKTTKTRSVLKAWILSQLERAPEIAQQLGLVLDADSPDIEIPSLRLSERVGPDGNLRPAVIIEVTQKRKVILDESTHSTADMRGGATLVVDLAEPVLRYCIRKDILSRHRLERLRVFLQDQRQNQLRATYFGSSAVKEPFAVLHRGLDIPQETW
jgi:hypothetical protein